MDRLVGAESRNMPAFERRIRMRTWLFLDDWLIEGKLDVLRRFHKPQPIPIERAYRLGLSTVIWDSERSRYRAWAARVGQRQGRLYESCDGISWNATSTTLPLGKGDFYERTWFFDPWDKDNEHRHKMPVHAYDEKGRCLGGRIACSPDGIHWRVMDADVWRPNEPSDTNNNIFFNPHAREWNVICRARHVDRRIAAVRSHDLRQWTEPEIILQADVLDPDMMQFYGMHVTLYEDIFIGFPLAYRVPAGEPREQGATGNKMYGRMEPQLAYSYDGRSWLRSDRSAFIPRALPGHPGGGSIYPRALLNSPDGQDLFIYSRATDCDHGMYFKAPLPKGLPVRDVLLLHRLRRDGFASLEPIGGWGEIRTRLLTLRAGKLTLNVEALPGRVLVQASDCTRRPLPGYTFEECVPITGDHLEAHARWRQHRDLRHLIGKNIHIEFKLLDASLYAMRLDANLCAQKGWGGVIT